MDPLFADFIANAGRVIIGALAVAGGFLIGNLLTLLACRVFAKFLLKQRLNEMLEKALRMIGGLALAILVAFLVFRGGSGWGFGGGGTGEGSGEEAKGEGKPGGEKPKDVPPKTPNTPQAKTETAAVLVVKVLKASASAPRFLVSKGDSGVELEEAKNQLQKWKDESGEKRLNLELHIYQNSPDQGNKDVRELLRFASQDLGVSTKVEILKELLE